LGIDCIFCSLLVQVGACPGFGLFCVLAVDLFLLVQYGVGLLGCSVFDFVVFFCLGGLSLSRSLFQFLLEWLYSFCLRYIKSLIH
jgi:hypothetical protein